MASRIRLVLAVALALIGPLVSPARAQTIIESWKSVAVPPAPELLPVTLDAATTALLVLDMNADACAGRPTCVASLPHIQRLLADARARRMYVVYSTSSSAPAAPVPAPIARAPEDPSVASSADKFIGTDLEKMLAARGIKTVIVVGTTAQGAVLFTASSAALHKLAVVVPVDGFSADTPFAALAATWVLKNAPVSISAHVTLSRTDLIALR